MKYIGFIVCLFLSQEAVAFVGPRQTIPGFDVTRPSSLSNPTSFRSDAGPTTTDRSTVILHAENVPDMNRRILWTKKATQVASVVVGVSAFVSLTRPVWGASGKSRTQGYQVQKTDQEWMGQLSPIQYNILRLGGTERPGFSILEKEKRSGTFQCAGCGTPLFKSKDKFNSGTGWPSFARGLPGVEVEQVNLIAANLSGAELRCATCGGHLGDVFQDGLLFVGTEAFKTGKRYCIDGAALVFYPDDGGDPLVGDTPKPQELPSWLEPPGITPKE